MKPDSPTNENINGEENNTANAMKILSSVINVAADVEGEYDLDDEVMSFMHSHIHKQLIKFTNKDASEGQQGMMDGDTKAYFDEVIRGSALFGLLPDKEEEFDDDEKENDGTFFGGQTRDNDDNQSQESQGNAAKFQLSKLLLTKKVAEAFKINRPDMNVDEDEGDTTLSGSATTNTMSWGARLMQGKVNAGHAEDGNENNSGSVSRQSEYSIETDLGAERQNLLEEDNAPGLAMRLETDLAGSIVALWQQRLSQSSICEGDIDIEYASDVNSTGPPSPRGDDASMGAPPAQFTNNISAQIDGNGNRSTNSTVPMRVPFTLASDSNCNTALEEIRARLRKTQFDYSADSGQKVSEPSPPQIDYRNVLKKKDNL